MIMTRVQAKENLIAIGIAEPTDEQVSNYLNQVNGETKKEKDKAEQYKADSEKVKELQSQLDEINNANLSEIERANKETENANKQVELLQSQIKNMQLKTSLAENGIKGEQADKLIDSLSKGEFDVSILGNIINERVTIAKAEKEKELLDNTPNPQGNAGSSDNGKSESEKIAESLGKSMAETSKTASDIVNAYC